MHCSWEKHTVTFSADVYARATYTVYGPEHHMLHNSTLLRLQPGDTQTHSVNDNATKIVVVYSWHSDSTRPNDFKSGDPVCCEVLES